MSADQALVLEGGALRSQYTAGVLDALLEAQVSFGYVIGVSAGASVGCSFVSGQHGRNTAIVEALRHDRRYLGLGNLLRTGSLFGMDFIYGEVPRSLFPFDEAAYRANPTRFVVVCTNIATGQAEYFEKDADLLTVLRASASMPFLAPFVTYQGARYLDGALADSIPWKRAVAEGFRRNVVVLTRTKGYRKKPGARWPVQWAYGRHPELVRAITTRWQRYNDDLAELEDLEAGGEVLVVRPSVDLGVGRTEGDVAKLRALYELGVADGRSALAQRRIIG